jgi:lysophospholipase L1-like esterase
MIKKIITYAGIALIVVTFTLAYRIDHQPSRADLQETTYVEVKVEAQEQPTEEIDPDLYGKLRSGYPIRYLVLGDSIGESDGADDDKDRWFLGLTAQLFDSYRGAVVHEINGTPGGVAFGGWIDYLTLKKNDRGYDMVILCFGQNDQSGMELEMYQASYEALVRKIKTDYPQAEIVTLVESSLSKEPYVDTIKAISSHYELLNVDTRAAFKASGKPYDTLTNDGTHPNSEGYKVYTQSIFDAIGSRIQSNVVTSLPSKLLFPNTTLFQSGRRNTNWENVKGFEITPDGAILGKAGASAELTFTGNLLGIEKLADVTGGAYEVYVDGKLISKSDNHAPFKVNWESLLAHNLGAGIHKATIKVPADAPDSAIVNISSLITS